MLRAAIDGIELESPANTTRPRKKIILTDEQKLEIENNRLTGMKAELAQLQKIINHREGVADPEEEETAASSITFRSLFAGILLAAAVIGEGFLGFIIGRQVGFALAQLAGLSLGAAVVIVPIFAGIVCLCAGYLYNAFYGPILRTSLGVPNTPSRKKLVHIYQEQLDTIKAINQLMPQAANEIQTIDQYNEMVVKVEFYNKHLHDVKCAKKDDDYQESWDKKIKKWIVNFYAAAMCTYQQVATIIVALSSIGAVFLTLSPMALAAAGVLVIPVVTVYVITRSASTYNKVNPLAAHTQKLQEDLENFQPQTKENLQRHISYRIKSEELNGKNVELAKQLNTQANLNRDLIQKLPTTTPFQSPRKMSEGHVADHKHAGKPHVLFPFSQTPRGSSSSNQPAQAVRPLARRRRSLEL